MAVVKGGRARVALRVRTEAARAKAPDAAARWRPEPATRSSDQIDGPAALTDARSRPLQERRPRAA